jgi:hypothetical protein
MTSNGSPPSVVAMSVQYVGAAVDSNHICSGPALGRVKELTFTEIQGTDA